MNTAKEFFIHARPIQRIAILGNYPPRRCGIASFTHDLTEALAKQHPEIQIDVIAMSDQSGYEYPAVVAHEIPSANKREFLKAASFINAGDYDVLLVQHEYGIFGGPDGAFLLSLLRTVNIPIVSTLHTVLREPTASQRGVMAELIRLSNRIVVMSAMALDILEDLYGLGSEDVDLIPHGIPDFNATRSTSVKTLLGITGTMILTFGLLSPDKGIQYAIKAMPKILESEPDAVYVVLGATHPHVKAYSGEVYRDSLVVLAEELGVESSVRFVDSFVEQAELVQYIKEADVYITPYLNAGQITSGTLAYAMGAGKSLISTPYLYAEELLAGGRGILVAFRNEAEIAEAFIQLQAQDSDGRAMRTSAREYCDHMKWPAVASKYWKSLNSATGSDLVWPNLAEATRPLQAALY